MLSIVIPIFNAAEGLAATLASLQSLDMETEILVVDGGSTDAGPEIARSLGATVITAELGRGHQLRAGAGIAAGEWLLFLHADTRLTGPWESEVAQFMDMEGDHRAAVFRLGLDDEAPQARRVERLVGWRTRRLGLPYGDQGLLISRKFYDELGGFRPMVMFEDVDMVRRIGRRRLKMLGAQALTSAIRYRREGYVARAFRNNFCLTLYFLGVPPAVIERLYR